MNISTTNSYSRPKFILKRNFSETNISNFCHSLSNIDWNSITEMTSAEQAYNSLTSIISNHFNTSFPNKKVKLPILRLRKPWMTNGLATSCKKKSTLYYKYKNNPTDYRANKYKTYRNK